MKQCLDVQSEFVLADFFSFENWKHGLSQVIPQPLLVPVAQIGFFLLKVQLTNLNATEGEIDMTSSWPVMTSSQKRHSRHIKSSLNVLNMHMMHIIRCRIFFFFSADSENVYIMTFQRSNRGQMGSISQNIPKIHIFRLRILSRIQIQGYWRSIQVIKSHKRSNFGRNH